MEDNKSNLDKAIATFEMIVKLNPKNAKAHNSLGLAYYDKGELDRAFESFRKALELDPDNTEFRKNLNKALHDESEKDKAIEERDKLDNLTYFPNVKPASGTAPRLQPVSKTPHIPPEQQAPYEDDPELAEFKQAQKKLEASIQKTVDIRRLYNRWAAGTGIDPTVFGEQLKLILDIPKDATVGFSRKKNTVGTKYVEIRWEREIKVNNDTKTESYEFSIGKLNANEELELHEDIAKALSAGKNWAESLKERRNKPARIK